MSFAGLPLELMLGDATAPGVPWLRFLSLPIVFMQI